MNEEALNDAYALFKGAGYNKSIEDFKQLLKTNNEALQDAHKLFVDNGYNKSVDDFASLIGVIDTQKKNLVDGTSPMEPMDSTLPQEGTSGLSESEELLGETESKPKDPVDLIIDGFSVDTDLLTDEELAPYKVDDDLRERSAILGSESVFFNKASKEVAKSRYIQDQLKQKAETLDGYYRDKIKSDLSKDLEFRRINNEIESKYGNLINSKREQLRRKVFNKEISPSEAKDIFLKLTDEAEVRIAKEKSENDYLNQKYMEAINQYKGEWQGSRDRLSDKAEEIVNDIDANSFFKPLRNAVLQIYKTSMASVGAGVDVVSDIYNNLNPEYKELEYQTTLELSELAGIDIPEGLKSKKREDLTLKEVRDLMNLKSEVKEVLGKSTYNNLIKDKEREFFRKNPGERSAIQNLAADFMDSAQAFEEMSDSIGLTTRLSDINSVGDFGDWAWNTVSQLGSQVAMSGLTGGGYLYAQGIADTYYDSLMELAEEHKEKTGEDLTMQEILDLSDSRMVASSMAGGITIGVLEKYGLDKLLKGNGIGLKAIVESGTEGLQEIVQAVATDVGTDKKFKDVADRFKSSEFWEQVGESSAAGAFGGGFVGGLGKLRKSRGDEELKLSTITANEDLKNKVMKSEVASGKYKLGDAFVTRTDINDAIENAKTPEDLNNIEVTDDKGIQDKLESKLNQLRDAVQKQETREVPDAEQAEGVQEVETEVRESDVEEARPIEEASKVSEALGSTVFIENKKGTLKIDDTEGAGKKVIFESEDGTQIREIGDIDVIGNSPIGDFNLKQEVGTTQEQTPTLSEGETVINTEGDVVTSPEGVQEGPQRSATFLRERKDGIIVVRDERGLQRRIKGDQARQFKMRFPNVKKGDGVRFQLSDVETEESVASADPTLDIPIKEEEKIDIAESIGNSRKVKANNVKGLLDVMGGVFGLNKKQAKSAAVVGDVMVETMAKRAGVSKDEMYQRIAFAKSTKEAVDNLSTKGKKLFQIVGENAQLGETIKENLQVARDMETSGKDTKTIRRATGWEKGSDGKWRYEIDDIEIIGDLKRFQEGFEGEGYTVSLGDFVDGDLLSAYPELKDKITIVRGLPSSSSFGTMGVLNKTKNGWDLYLSDNIFNGDLDYGKSVLIHEIQHAIQDIEGFSKGGSPETMSTRNDALRRLLDNIPEFSRDDSRKIKDAYEKAGLKRLPVLPTITDVESDNPSVLEDWIEKLEVLADVFPKNNTYRKIQEFLDFRLMEMGGVNVSLQKYLNLAGEVEARNVQTRMGMTPEQRMETTLQETEDVSRDEQVVLFQGARGAMVSEDVNAIIFALTNPNVSTPLHELAHVYENYLTEQERKTIQDWAGTDTWTTETSEKFARGFERFLAGGEIKNQKLKQAFNNFKKWLTEIYNGIVGSDIDIELNDTMKDIYNTMLGSDIDQKTTSEVSISDTKRTSELKERQSDQKKKDVISFAEKAINTLKSVLPNFEIYIHDSVDSYNSFVDSIGAPRASRGNFAYRTNENGNIEGRIDINLSTAGIATVAHEVTHGILLATLDGSPQLYQNFRRKISSVLSDSTNKKLNDFANQYVDNDGNLLDVTHEEYLSELTALLSQQGKSLPISTLEKIAKIINQIVSKATKGKLKPFQSTANKNDILEYFNSISRAISEGASLDGVTERINTEAPSTGKNVDVKSLESKSSLIEDLGLTRFPDMKKRIKTGVTLNDLGAVTSHLTFSDRLATGKVGDKDYLGGILFAAATNRVWAAFSKGRVSQIINGMPLNEDGYRYLMPAILTEESHMSNKDMTNTSIRLVEDAVESNTIVAEDANKRISKSLNRKGLEKSKDIYSEYIEKNGVSSKSVSDGIKKSLSETTFEQRKIFLESLLGKADIDKSKRFGGLPSFSGLANGLAEPITSGHDYGDILLTIRTKGDLVAVQPKETDPDYHPSYPWVIRALNKDGSIANVETLIFNESYSAIDVFPKVTNKKGEILTYNQYVEKYGDKAKSFYLGYMGGRSTMSTSVTEQVDLGADYKKEISLETKTKQQLSDQQKDNVSKDFEIFTTKNNISLSRGYKGVPRNIRLLRSLRLKDAKIPFKKDPVNLVIGNPDVGISIGELMTYYKKSLFSAKRFFGKDLFKGKELKEAEIAKNLNIMEQNVAKLNRAIRKNKLDSEDQIQQLDFFLRRLPNTLNEKIIPIATEIRQHIDSLSQILIDNGWVADTKEYVVEKVSKDKGEYFVIDTGTGSRIKLSPAQVKQIEVDGKAPAEGETVTISSAVNNNLGEYLTRSYKIFDDANWKDKVEDVIVQRAKNLYRQQLRPVAERLQLKNAKEQIRERLLPQYTNDDGTVNELELNKQVENEYSDMDGQQIGNEIESILEQMVDNKIDEVLKSDDVKGFLKKGKLGSKDLSILKERKDIPLEIRMLMGEYTDPIQNYARTILKQSSLVANQRFLESAKKMGMGNFFFEADQPRPRGFDFQIAAEGSETMSPLNGLYTTKEIYEQFQDASESLPGYFEIYMKAISGVKWAKTIASVTTHLKNFFGNLAFMAANGHWRVGEMNKAFAIIKNDISSKSNEELNQMMNEYIDLTIVKQSAGLNEIRDMFKDANFDEAMYQRLSKQPTYMGKAKRSGLKLKKFFEDVYGGTDDLFKIVAYENEMSRYSQALYGKDKSSLTEAERGELSSYVAEIVKNTYPTYSRVPEAIQLIRRFPLLGNFVSFQAESWRTAYNTLNIAKNEMKSDNPKVRKIGRERIIGITSYLAVKDTLVSYLSVQAGMGLSGIIGSLIDDDDEKEKQNALKKYVAPWNKNSEKIMLEAKGGQLKYIDVSSSDPYGGIAKVFNALASGDDLEEKAVEGFLAAIEPFTGVDITTNTLSQIIYNDNGYGGRIYNPEDPNRLSKKLIYAIKKLEPGTISSMRRLGDAENLTQEITAQLLGLRTYDINLSDSFGFKFIGKDGYRERLKNAKSLFSQKYDKDATLEEIVEGKKVSDNALQDVYIDIYDDLSAAVRLGAPVPELIKKMKSLGLSNKEIKIVLLAGNMKGDD